MLEFVIIFHKLSILAGSDSQKNIRSKEGDIANMLMALYSLVEGVTSAVLSGDLITCTELMVEGMSNGEKKVGEMGDKLMATNSM